MKSAEGSIGAFPQLSLRRSDGVGRRGEDNCRVMGMGKREPKKRGTKKNEHKSESLRSIDSRSPAGPSVHVVLWDEPPKGDAQEDDEDDQASRDG